MSLTETLETHGVAPLPGGKVGSSLDSICAVTSLAKSTALASSGSETSALSVLVYRVTDPVDAGIIADLGVGRIYKDDLVVLHGGVLVDPVRVQYTKVGELASYLLLSNGLKITLKLKVVDTLVLGLTEYHTTVILTLTSSTTYTYADNNVSLLSLVTKTVSLVGTGGAVAANHLWSLTVLPGTNAEKETEGVTLLVTPKLFHVLVGSHTEKLSNLYQKGIKM
mmetsp:Transcript_3127/g.3605  ORF Transcript_3127/g.3605 Transcript_3127/m.3605 type:complete len:223 (+) Transcript_3127:204-872(+)|eukprot:CAMPEP_0204625392 /NCGR_PEP_ID=MMETSP0717-20131115/11153_1 /ASSEMBLY_ACC=CAM_ASM_000666 /TAXON_ID=230516 /ORGANISM="Chaetoceros curvisetus" /LENGTH=222 /DNA_ID=CAMNT_0051641091 /DNA_START=191 /DNA_END=859 /DNA_ORIENTATION=-